MKPNRTTASGEMRVEGASEIKTSPQPLGEVAGFQSRRVRFLSQSNPTYPLQNHTLWCYFREPRKLSATLRIGSEGCVPITRYIPLAFEHVLLSLPNCGEANGANRQLKSLSVALLKLKVQARLKAIVELQRNRQHRERQTLNYRSAFAKRGEVQDERFATIEAVLIGAVRSKRSAS